MALRLGYELADTLGASYVVTLDADGQNDPAEIPDLLAPVLADEADFVIASRRLGVDETSDDVRRAGVVFFASVDQPPDRPAPLRHLERLPGPQDRGAARRHPGAGPVPDGRAHHQRRRRAAGGSGNAPPCGTRGRRASRRRATTSSSRCSTPGSFCAPGCASGADAAAAGERWPADGDRVTDDCDAPSAASGRPPDLVFTAVSALLFGLPAALGATWLVGDNLIQNFPLRVLVGIDLRHGHLPLWDPFLWSGSPLLAGFNAGAAYPTTALFAVLPGALAWVLNQMAVEVVAAAGVAGAAPGPRSVLAGRGPGRRPPSPSAAS